MEVYFLEAALPLSKTYTATNEARTQFDKSQYPLVRDFTSHKETVDSIESFGKAIRYHAANGHCLLKGLLTKDLESESRAGSTSPFTKTQWLCLDFDYIDDESEVPLLLSKLGLHDVDYVMQYSAGHGIDKTFGAHLFFFIDKPVLPEQLKLWLIQHNLKIDLLSQRISLTRSNVALRWPLDVSVAQNDKLIFLAPPECKNFDDPVEERLMVVRGKHRVATIADEVNQLDASVIDEMKNGKLKELRRERGLPAKKLTMKTIGNIEVAKNPGAVNVTGQREQRGFMYLNLNGGDSWGYYHPVDNPEILFNFKGEPNYLTKELVPTYYKAYKKQLIQERQVENGEESTKFLAFLDRRTDKYFRGTYEPKTDTLELFQTTTTRKVEDFLKQHDQFVPEFIEEWDYVFRFDDDRQYVPEERMVNRYKPTEYLKYANLLNMPSRFPPTILKVLRSVCGDDKDVLKHFLNWLAFILQKRQRAQTAWVFNGIEGTGKGVLVHHILAPIFGRDVVQVKSLANLEEDFNGYMENTVFLMLDESKRSQLRNPEKAMAKLKQVITDPVVPIRRMQTDHYMARNYMNVIVTSNHRDPIHISPSDRRFNVGVYQNKKLEMTEAEIDQVGEELGDFTKVLMNMKVDEHAARTPLDNAARREMKFVTRTSLEVTFNAFLEGDLEHFIEHIPTNRDLLRGEDAIAIDHVIRILRVAERHAIDGSEHVMSRDEVYVLMQHVLGDMPDTIQRFVSLVKHHGIHFTRVQHNKRRMPGYIQQWRKPELTVNDLLGDEEELQLRSVK